MKNRILSVLILFTFLLSSAKGLQAQCTTANVNWDNLDYISTQSNANYATYINTPALVTNMVQTQRFALGTNRVVITATHPSSGILGENTTHTGEGGSNGTGADINFTGNGTITMTFDTAVSNVLFSIYDLDASQRATITAAEGVTPRAVTLTKPAGGNVTIAANVATGAASSQANNVNVATLNVSVAGPVTSITIVFSNTAGDFWISDIQACVYRSFLTNYYSVSQPFTGQPEYVLVVHDLNTVYMLNPATGQAKSIFTDTDPRVREINNLAYDPYKRIIYYSVDGLERCTPAGNPDSIRHIKKYDVDLETISTVTSDVKTSPIYIPTYNSGLESGGGGFYNGSLYMGVEAYFLTGTRNSGRETAIWRIDFAADSVTANRSCQVWATPVDDGSNNIHDYADFVMKDGVLYTFNSSVNAPGGRGAYTHHNMQTGATITTIYPSASANRPQQAAQDWDGTLYWVAAEIGVYNGTTSNTVTSKQTIDNHPRSTNWVGPAGDAAEAFRPKADFGDAPASYDPVALSPALNEKDTAIRIGSNWSWEWTKKTSGAASADNFDDGIAAVSIFDPGTQTYLVQVQVYNNTGSNATLCAWLDYNGNGVFDASEGLAPVTISSSASMQTRTLHWIGINSPLANGSYTFLRVRFTTSTMTTSSATGYFADGETEDYRVLVDNFPLAANLLSFTATLVNSSHVKLNWISADEKDLSGYSVERSADAINWTAIGFVNARANNSATQTNYLFNDYLPLAGRSYYRLKMQHINGSGAFSEYRTVYIANKPDQLVLLPNPAQDKITLSFNSHQNRDAQVFIYDMQGRQVRAEKFRITEGNNLLRVNNLNKLANGTYVIQLIASDETLTRKLVIKN